MTLEEKQAMESKSLNYNPAEFKKAKGNGGNFVKLQRGEKGQYRDKLCGTAQFYKTRFLPNGRQKSFYKNRNTEVTDPFAIQSEASESENEYEIENGVKKIIIKSEHLLQDVDTIISKSNIFYSLLNKATKLF